MAIATAHAPIPVPVRAKAYLRFGLHNVRVGFRRWRRTRPFWAGVWTILGATLIAYVPATAYQFMFATTSIAVGITVGAVIGLLGLLLWVHRVARFFYGIVIILLSLVSFMTSDFGGLFLGMLMSIIGGSLALSWVPKGYQSRRRRRKAAALAAAAPAPEDADAGVTIVLPDEPRVIDLTTAEEQPDRHRLWSRTHARHGR